MSSALSNALKALFGQDKYADCTISFYLDSSERPLKKQKTGKKLTEEPLGDPLPAHLLVLCGGSPRFDAQAERWAQDNGDGKKPVLRVPLGSKEELPYAHEAVRFIYTGKLTVSGAEALLQVRKLAAYLQVEGCVGACDEALVRHVSNTAAQSSSAASWTGVADLYNNRQLMPDASLEPAAVRSIMHACRKALASCVWPQRAVPAGTPSLGELLGWAFGDAPSVLSDPEVRRQMEQLSAAAMEALLGSETLATDDESSVLLLLATWLQANPTASEDARKRLCGLVRLSQLGSVYLTSILPVLPWFPITPAEHRFLCRFVAAENAQKRQLTEAASGRFNCSSPWYCSKARPAPARTSAPRKYDWYIFQEGIRAQLSKGAETKNLDGCFTNGARRVVAHGFEWYPFLIYAREKEGTFSLFLACCLPSALCCSEALIAVVCPGPARLSVHKWLLNGSRQDAWSFSYASTHIPVGMGITGGQPVCVKAPPPRGGGQGILDPLAGWAPYLREGKLSGVLEWTS